MPLADNLHRCIATVLLALAGCASYADSWKFEPKITTSEHTYGEVRVVLTEDARQNQKVPAYLLTVYNGDVEIARIPGVAFETLHASPDHKLFVGLSNSGIPGTAAVTFNASGEISLIAVHGLAEFDYCERSVTLLRTWYDAEKPEAEFKFTGDQQGIYLRSCHGERVELLHTVSAACATSIARAQRKK